uniref:Uncharacterized protein n=1 Tax=Anguilla anguilla TaxID=7936 RepID=A0A0E9VKC1_ANGAN
MLGSLDFPPQGGDTSL